jgi:HK97 family phage portal protein
MNPFKNALKAISQLPKMIFSKNSNLWWFVNNKDLSFRRDTEPINSNVVMAPVFYIMKKEPDAPIALKGEDGELINQHPMLSLLSRPNPYYSSTLLRMGIDLSFILDGNAYLVKIRDSRLAVRQLWYVPHTIITPYVKQGSENFIDYYKYMPGGREIELSTDDVVHFRYGIDPDNIRKGLSPLKSALKEIYTDEEAAAFSANILRNSGVPGIIVSPASDSAGRIPDKELTETKEFLKTQFTGAHRGEPLALSGPTKVEKYSFSPADMDLSAIRNVPEERICALLSLPAVVVGFGTGTQQTRVGAATKELREMAYTDGIMPLQKIYAEELHTQLLPEFEPNPDKFKVVFDYSDIKVLQEDKKNQDDGIRASVTAGILRVDKAQAWLGYEVDDSQAVYLRSMATIEVPAEEKSKPRETTQTETGKMFKSASRTATAANRLMRVFYADELKLRDMYANQLEKRFRAFGKLAAHMYVDEMEARGEKSLTDEIVLDVIMSMLVTQEAKEALFGFPAYYIKVAGQTIASINDVTDIGAKLTDMMEMNLINAGGKRLGLIDLKSQTKNAIFEAITEGRTAGEGVTSIAKRIESMVGGGRWKSAKTRAEVVSRTETKYAQNYSSLEAYKESDNVGAVLVFDSQIGSFDEYCDAVNGRTVTFDEAAFLREEEHPNGTRSFAPVFAREDLEIDGLPEGVPPNNP